MKKMSFNPLWVAWLTSPWFVFASWGISYSIFCWATQKIWTKLLPPHCSTF